MNAQAFRHFYDYHFSKIASYGTGMSLNSPTNSSRNRRPTRTDRFETSSFIS